MENSMNILLRLAEDSMEQRKQKEERILELEKLLTEAQTKIENDKEIIQNLQKKLKEKETQLKILGANYQALSAANKAGTKPAKKRKAIQITASDCDKDSANGSSDTPAPVLRKNRKGIHTLLDGFDESEDEMMKMKI